MTYKEAVYLVMDLLHLMSDDAGYTEQHIIFLLNKYRIFLLKGLDKDAPSAARISDSAYQTIDLTLNKIDTPYSAISCEESYMVTPEYYMWRSDEEVPEYSTIGTPKVTYLSITGGTNYFYIDMPFVSIDRLEYVGQNKWMRQFLYCAVGPDRHLYAKSVNGSHPNPFNVKFKAIFENPEDAFDENTDILDQDFPMDEALIPQLIDYVVKLIAAAEYRPDDPYNNATDDLARIAQYLRSRMKTDFQRQLDI